MYRITKDVHFSYGHRLVKHAGKCSRLHGHNARVQVELSSQVLDEQAMVVDFEHVSGTIGEWIRKELDHRMILWEKDPAAKVLLKAGESIVTLKEHPTAEVLAKIIYKEAQLLRLPVSRVIFWETPGSCAAYHE